MTREGGGGYFRCWKCVETRTQKFVATEVNFTYDSRCYRNLKAPFMMLTVFFLYLSCCYQ